MERRNAIIAMLAASVGVMSHRAVAAPLKPLIHDGYLLLSVGPQTVSFNLDVYDRFDFFHGKEKVSLTGAEIFAALKAKETIKGRTYYRSMRLVQAL